MSAPNAALAVCDRVARTFGHGPTAVVAVHGVSCEVTTISQVALVGPSGSGKSTLLNLLAELDEPTAGTLRWPSWDAGPLHDPTRVGLVFQGASLIPALSAGENAAFPLLLQGLAPHVAMARAIASLDLVGIGSLVDKVPGELSGGQAQRVAVARVIAAEPQLILADEPTGRLDRTTGELVVEVLIDAAEHLGAGLVLSTHDAAVAKRMREVWHMRDGELVA